MTLHEFDGIIGSWFVFLKNMINIVRFEHWHALICECMCTYT